MLAHEYVAPDGDGPARLDLIQLGGQPADEVLQPDGEVHLLFTHALDRLVEGAAVSIVELAQREEALEVVACAIEAKGREQARGAAVAVHEGVDMNELELRDAGPEDRMNGRLTAEPFHQLAHQRRQLLRRWR